MKPILAKDVLRQVSPREAASRNGGIHNRFSFLRDSSPAVGREIRDRSASVKRKCEDQVSYAEAASGPNWHNRSGKIDLTEVANIIESTTNSCAQLATKVELYKDVELKEVLRQLVTTMQGISKAQFLITNELRKVGSQTGPGNAIGSMVSLGAVAKKSRPASSQPKVRNDVEASDDDIMSVCSEEAVPPRVSKFRDAVRRAERSTLVFDLDMGKVPIMNAKTLSNSATLALTRKAAESEGKLNGIPSQDTVEAIDDFLSITTDMEFFGGKSKSYRNPRDPEDPRNGSYCTLPVRYEFRNRDMKYHAEEILRKRCKVNCSTPYPLMLRATIKQVVDRVRKEVDDSFVKVNVDLDKLCLRISRKIPDNAGNGFRWETLKGTVPIPDEALDLTIRKVPDHFKVNIPDDVLYKGKRLSRRDSHEQSSPKNPSGSS